MTANELDTQTQRAIAAELKSTATRWGSSRWSELSKCGFGYHLRYHLRVVPAERASYFTFGTLAHACLSYSARNPANRWQDVIAFARQDAATYPTAIVDQVEVLIGAYFARWGHEATCGFDASVEVVAVEELIEVPASPGVEPYSTRLDLQLRVGDELAFCDHKTAGSTPITTACDVDELRRQLATRPQFLGSSWALREALGLSYAPPMIVNYLIKTKVPKFLRVFVPFTNAQLDMWNENRAPVPTRDGPVPRRDLHNCAPAIGMPCWAFDYCHGNDRSKEIKFKQLGENE